MVRAPADTDLETTLALAVTAVDVPDPLRTADRDDRDAAAGHEHRRGALAVADAADVRHGERAAAPGQLSEREAAGHLPAEVRDALQLRREGVDGVRVYALQRRGV